MAITPQTLVREYELTYLIGSGYTTAEMNSFQDEMIALIGKQGGEIITTQDWGKKPLAYSIKKDGKTYTEAVYSQLVIKLPPAKVQALSQSVELKRQILRSLLVLK
jgi:small subunit ribosomal protein S6